MAIQDILAAVLNPNGVWDLGGPENRARLAAAGSPMTAQGAAPMPQQTVPGGVAQQMPQQAPQAAPAPSGGSFGESIGDLLSGLFNPQARGRNETIHWLTQQGYDPGTAKVIASDKGALRSVILGRGKGNEFSQRAAAAQQYGLDPNSDEGRAFILGGKVPEPPNARDQFGLSPIYGKDDQGNLVVMQPSKSGGLVKADLPPGVTLQPGTDKIDLGTSWGITDRSGSIISVIPKDIAGAEQEKATGKARGEVAFDLPRIEQNAEQTLGIIEQLKNHPGRATATGKSGTFDPRNYIPGTDATNFNVMLDQAKGQVFLQAYQTLKGGGQITEVEGKKAQDAIARLNRAQSDDEFVKALDDFEGIIRIGLDRARRQAGAPQPSTGVSATNSTPSPPSLTGDTPPQGWKGKPELWKYMSPEDRALWQ